MALNLKVLLRVKRLLCQRLVRSKAQSELTGLERGRHALHNPAYRRKIKLPDGTEGDEVDIRAYANNVGRIENTVGNEVKAARVTAEAVIDVGDTASLSRRFSQLVEIPAVAKWLWASLVAAMHLGLHGRKAQDFVLSSGPCW
jgi:hypothetical protein